jgi:hypothetical protein
MKGTLRKERQYRNKIPCAEKMFLENDRRENERYLEKERQYRHKVLCGEKCFENHKR